MGLSLVKTYSVELETRSGYRCKVRYDETLYYGYLGSIRAS